MVALWLRPFHGLGEMLMHNGPLPVDVFETRGQPELVADLFSIFCSAAINDTCAESHCIAGRDLQLCQFEFTIVYKPGEDILYPGVPVEVDAFGL